MSLSLGLGIVGAVVGNMIAPGIGGAVGYLAGTLLGNLLDPPKIEGPRLNDLKLQTSEYGRPIPLLYGTMRIAGNVIWQTDLHEHKEKSGGKGGPQIINYTYSASFAVMLCEGPVDGIDKVFADGRLVWPSDDDSFDFTLYTGTEDQLPDPTMEADLGVGQVPAHRGYAYVVFDELMLTEFGNRIPQLEFVVSTEPHTAALSIVKDNYDTGSVDRSFATILNWPYNGEPVVTSLMVEGDYVAELNNAATYDADTLDVNGVPDESFYAWPQYHGTDQRVGIGRYIYGNGNTMYLWAREVNTFASYNYLRDETGAINFCIDAGIPGGLYPVGCATTQDMTAVFVFTSAVSISASATHWYKIVDGIVAADGTVSAGPGALLSPVRGQQSYQLGASASVSFENNGRYCWYFSPADEVAHIFYIDDAGNLDDWGNGTLAVPGFTHSGGPPSNAGVTTLAREGYCGVAYGPGLALLTRIGPRPGIPLSEIVADISSRTTLTVAEYDVTDLTPLVPGYLVTSQMEARNAIYPLQMAYFFDAVESGEAVVFVERGHASVVTIEDDDLAARMDDENAPAVLKTVRTQEAELPARVYVEYLDAAFDYQQQTQYDERQVTGSQSQTTVTLPISLDATTALQIAGMHVWGAYQERERYTWFTSDKFAQYEPTDVVTVQGIDIRIESKRETPSGVIEWVGVYMRTELYVAPSTATGVVSSSPGQTAPVDRPLTRAVLLDIPILSQSDAPFGFYAAMAPASSGPWTGAGLYKSVDGGTTYTLVASSSDESTIGTTSSTAAGSPSVTGVLADYAGGDVVDNTSVVCVVLSSDNVTLSSVSDTALVHGANLCAISNGVLPGSPAGVSWELLNFRDAVLVAPRTYQLSGFWRGRYGSTPSGHAEGDTFVLLPVTNVDAPESELNQTLLYKAVTFGKTLVSATAFYFTNTGLSTEQFYETELNNLDVFVGDIGSPSTPKKGLVPAPAVGDCAAGKFLSACGGWSVPAGTGSGSPSGGGSIEVRDEGGVLTSAASVIDFTGSGITATYSAGVVTVNVPGGLALGSPSIAGTYGDSFNSPVITVNDYGLVTAITSAPIYQSIITEYNGSPIDLDAIALNFVGAGVTVTDSGYGITEINIPDKAPLDAYYLLRMPHASLPNGATLLAGAGITITESGGSPPTSLTIASSVGNGSTSQSQAFTTAGAFTCYIPAGVTAIRVTAIGAGGGGSTRASAIGGAGGGSGEMVMSFVMNLDTGSPNVVTGSVGAKGTGASAGGGSAAGNPGGDTTVTCGGITINARGGLGGTSAGVGGAGGGFRGGTGGGSANPGGAGAAGTAEAVTHFAGGGGGGGGSTTGANGGLGAASGGYDTPARANAASTQGGGGGGASTPYGLGGAGGGGGSAGNNAASTSYGAGGGGAGGLTGNTAAGGNGCDGYVLIEYVAAP